MAKKKSSKTKAVEKRRKQLKKSKAGGTNIIIGKNEMHYLQEIWAEHGIVKARRRDGIVKSMTWESAAFRAKQLNDAVPMLPHASTKKSYLELIERILGAVKEARRQLETPDKKTKGLHNLLAGRNQDGSQVNIGKIEDYLIDDYLKQFPSLGEDEIQLVLKNDRDWPTIQSKENALRVIHKERMKAEKNATAGGADKDILSQAAN